MRKNRFLTLLVVALCALAAASCTKEPQPEPDNTFTPLEANHYTYLADSAAITKVVLTCYQGEYTYSFSNGSQYLFFITTPSLTAEPQDLATIEAYVNDGSNSIALRSGTFSCRPIGSNYLITLNGTTADGPAHIYYYGPLLNTTAPNGSGQLNIGGLEVPLNMLYSEYAYGSYSYVFTDTAASFSATFYSTQPIADRTYNLTDDDSQLDNQGNMLLYVEGERNGHYVFGVAQSGSLTFSHNGATVSAQFSGQLIDEATNAPMQFSGTYTGTLIQL